MMPETPLFSKTYAWSLWLFQKTSGFPKRFRHTLTERLESDTLNFERTLLEANAYRDGRRRQDLDRADVLLAALRVNLRRSFDLRCLAGGSYEHAARMLNEIGRLLGAWKESTPGGGS